MTPADGSPLLALVSPRTDGERSAARADGPSDEELVERAASGDRWAEEALYRRHARAVTNAVARLVGRDAEADDIVQDTFVMAFERIDTLRNGAAFRGWIAMIALNRVRAVLRRRKVLRMIGVERDPAETGVSVFAVDGTRPDLRAELRELDRILARLSVDERMTWMLHRVEGWSLAETAEAMECSSATVKRRLTAADSAIEIARTGRGFRT